MDQSKNDLMEEKLQRKTASQKNNRSNQGNSSGKHSKIWEILTIFWVAIKLNLLWIWITSLQN